MSIFMSITIECLAIEKFKATACGKIYSVKTGKEIKLRKQCGGYLRFNFRHGKKHHTVLAHRFVWVYFHGSICEYFDIHHIDTDRENNAIRNLLKVTRKFNCNHKRTHLRAFDTMQRMSERIKELGGKK